MVTFTRGISRMETDKDKEHIFGLTTVITKVNGSLTK